MQILSLSRGLIFLDPNLIFFDHFGLIFFQPRRVSATKSDDIIITFYPPQVVLGTIFGTNFWDPWGYPIF